MPSSQLTTDLMTCLRGLKALARKEAARHHLSMNAFIAVRVIGHHGEVTMRALAEHLDVTPGACTQLVDRLAEQGLVARRAGVDRRAVHVELTEAGRALRDQLAAGITETLEAAIAGIAGEHRAEIERSVAALATAFGTMHLPSDGDYPSCNSPNPVAP